MTAAVPPTAPVKKKVVKPKKTRSKIKGQIPVMQDVIFTISRLIVILVGLATTGVSLFVGAEFWMAVARGAAAMFSLGIILWIICWQINHDTLETTRKELMTALEESRRKEAEAQEKADEENLGTLVETQV